MRSYLSFVFLLGLTLLSGCYYRQAPRLIDKPAPDFTLNDGAHTLHLRDYRGRTVVLNFWAPWCPPCADEAPSMTAMQHDLTGKVVVLGVCTGVKGQPCDEDLYRRFLTQYGVDFFTIRDQAYQSNLLYGTVAFPESYIIDSKGIVRRKIVGPIDWTKPDILDYLRKVG